MGGGFAVYPTSGVLCATLKGHVGTAASDSMGGPIINQNASMDATANRDYYRFGWNSGSWTLKRYIDNSADTLASDSDHDPADNSWGMNRLYRSGDNIVARYGATALANVLSVSDTTYTSGLYGGFVCGSTAAYVDDLDLRTSHAITCTGMTEGHYLRVSDGTTAAEAAASGGTATVDAGAVLFPLASVQIRTAAAGGGDLVAELTSSDLSDMGGGDTYTYSGTITKRLGLRKVVV